MLFVDGLTHSLKSVQLDGSGLTTIVPFPTTDYLVSSNLSLRFFRGTNGNLQFCRAGMPKPELIRLMDERFLMKQAAFSPSGKFVAYASKKKKSVELVNLSSGRRTLLPLVPKFGFDDPLVAWSPDEHSFYVGGFEITLRLIMSVQPDGSVRTEQY